MRVLKVLIRFQMILALVLCLGLQESTAQSIDPVEVAREYFNQGEIEKAKSEYQKLARNKRNIIRIHDNYLKLLISTEDFQTAEKYMKRVIRDFPGVNEYEVDLGVLYRAKQEDDKADAHLDRLIDRVTKESAAKSSTNQIRILAQVFFEKNFREKALQAYVKGREAFQRNDMFSLDLANVYRVMNKKALMVKEYLNFSKEQPRNISYVKNTLQRVLSEPEDLDTLEITLYDFIQREAGNPVFNELLVWTHLQQKNFPAALRQARALDRRLANNGENIIQVGMISFRNKDYKSASKAFNYVINEFPESNSRRLASRYALLSEEEVLTTTYPVDKEAIRTLITKYEKFKTDSRDIFSIMEAQRRIALLQAFQLNEIEAAIATLQDLLSQPVGKHRVVAEAKMDLADIYLLNKEPWESILLYGQVERMFKDEPLGYSAKLKSAKLSYFKGDFELAKSNLDILKLATSREIANDALDLSILIKNNTVFDSTDVVMREYANVELMLFQNQKDEALTALDSMLVKYDVHSIVDEVLYLKATTLRELGNFEEALTALGVLNQSHYFEILGDDALFLTGVILEDDLKRTEEAMNVYTDLLTKFPGSIYVSEARTRFRELRGDYNN